MASYEMARIHSQKKQILKAFKELGERKNLLYIQDCCDIILGFGEVSEHLKFNVL